MDEEKRPLPGYKEFLERMYGVEIPEPTPEELAEARRFLEQYRKQHEERKASQDGPKDT